jgi:hypothetical protein
MIDNPQPDIVNVGVGLWTDVRSSSRFHSFNNMNHGRSSEGVGDNPVASPMHSPLASKLTGKSELSSAFYHKLCQDH